MIQLRHRGVYKLPGEQRKVIAFDVGQSSYYLYDYEFGTRLPPRFKIDADGRLINWFQDFPIWAIEDLIDTEETYQG